MMFVIFYLLTFETGCSAIGVGKITTPYVHKLSNVDLNKLNTEEISHLNHYLDNKVESDDILKINSKVPLVSLLKQIRLMNVECLKESDIDFDIVNSHINSVQKLAENYSLVSAAVFLGDIYLVGSCIKREANKSFYWFLEAAKNGDIYAMSSLGGLYLTSVGVKQNITEAIKWSKLAAAEKNISAIYNLGIIATKYPNIDSLNSPLHYFELAGKLGHPKAQYNVYIGSMKSSSEIIKKGALKWLILAADSGYVLAEYELAKLYLSNDNQKDKSKALMLLRLSSKKNHVLSQSLLGRMLLSEKSREESNQDVEELLKKASEAGDINATITLADLYLNLFEITNTKAYEKDALLLIDRLGALDKNKKEVLMNKYKQIKNSHH